MFKKNFKKSLVQAFINVPQTESPITDPVWISNYSYSLKIQNEAWAKT